VLRRSRQPQTLPDFLGIGAQRAGTTWLHENLRRHPQVWLPPLKELHYFDRAASYPSPSFLAEASLLARALGRGAPSEQWRRKLWGNLRRQPSEVDWRELPWYVKFFLGRYDDRWYGSLFREAGDKVKGEITPSYALLEPGDIRHVKALMPAAKILFILRHPIDRAWSAIRYSRRRRARQADDLPLATLKRIADEEWVSARGDYVHAIRNWGAHFPAEQFFIGFFEDIAHRPRQFLIDLFAFLEVEPSEKHVTELAFRTINPSPQRKIPRQFELYLAQKVYPQTVALSEMVGSHACQWRQEVERLLETGSG